MKNNESIWLAIVLITAVVIVACMGLTSRVKRLESDVEAMRVRLIYGEQK